MYILQYIISHMLINTCVDEFITHTTYFNIYYFIMEYLFGCVSVESYEYIYSVTGIGCWVPWSGVRSGFDSSACDFL